MEEPSSVSPCTAVCGSRRGRRRCRRGSRRRGSSSRRSHMTVLKFKYLNWKVHMVGMKSFTVTGKSTITW